MRVVVTGASGVIGSALAQALRERGDSVVGVSRRPEGRSGPAEQWVAWDDLPQAIAGSDAAVHLVGASLAGGRWTGKRKRILRESRIGTARRLVEAIAAADAKPSTLLSMSAVGYYGSRGDETLSESAGPGAGFLATLCRDWEAAVQGAGVRTVVVRNAVVLTPAGGALSPMLRAFRFGLGGPVGRGRQWMPWVHIDDVVGFLLHALDHDTVEGVYNLAGPQPLTNIAFSKALGRALHRPALLPLPTPALRLLFGEAAIVLTGSLRVLSARAEESGYQFRYRTADAALADVVG